MGEGLNDSICWWTVAAEQVPQVLGAAVGELFPDTATLREWIAARGIPAVEQAWQGRGARPVDEDRFLLEALRDVIGTAERDQGQQIAGRFIAWLTRHGIGYEFDEQVGEAY